MSNQRVPGPVAIMLKEPLVPVSLSTIHLYNFCKSETEFIFEFV